MCCTATHILRCTDVAVQKCLCHVRLDRTRMVALFASLIYRYAPIFCPLASAVNQLQAGSLALMKAELTPFSYLEPFLSELCYMRSSRTKCVGL